MMEDRGLVDIKLTMLWLRTGCAHRHAAAGSFKKLAERVRDMVPVCSEFDVRERGEGVRGRYKSRVRCDDANGTSGAVWPKPINFNRRGRRQFAQWPLGPRQFNPSSHVRDDIKQSGKKRVARITGSRGLIGREIHSPFSAFYLRAG